MSAMPLENRHVDKVGSMVQQVRKPAIGHHPWVGKGHLEAGVRMVESRCLVSASEPVNVACLLVLAPLVEPCWNPSTSIVDPDISRLNPRLDQGTDERVHGLDQGIDHIVAISTTATIVE